MMTVAGRDLGGVWDRQTGGIFQSPLAELLAERQPGRSAVNCDLMHCAFSPEETSMRERDRHEVMNRR